MNIGNYRAPFIDYRNPGIFMITMVKGNSTPVFSSLFRTGLEDKYKGTNVRFSKLGKLVFEILKAFNDKCKTARIQQFVIMPDHVHFIFEILKRTELTLDDYINLIKNGTFSRGIERGLLSADDFLFETGYNDQYLTHSRSLHGMYIYIWENPYRLWIRREYPEFFTRINNGKLFGYDCQFYGNIEILKNPFIYPVVIHSSYTPEEKIRHSQMWEYAIENGGVLASAFIHPEEKIFRDKAFAKNAKVILFRSFKLDERAKPEKQYFEQCERGNLLIVAPTFPDEIEIPIDKYGRVKITKLQSRFMNSILERFGSNPGPAFGRQNSPAFPYPQGGTSNPNREDPNAGNPQQGRVKVLPQTPQMMN